MKIYLIMAVIILVLSEFVPLIKKKKKKEAAVVMIFISLSLIILLADWLKIGNLMEVLYNMVSPLTKLIFKT